MKTLGLMTSGGDASGMNAAIGSITRPALGHGFRVLGSKRGYKGILNAECQELDARSVSTIVHRVGTILKTARSTVKRIATAMIGGVVTSTIMGLAVYPAIFYIWRGWRLADVKRDA